jgi:short-subunit dehydrogenase
MATPQRPTVVITGASSGIGRALAVELAKRGYALGLTARRMPLLEALRGEIRSANGADRPVELATLDVCQTASVRPALHELFGRLGGVDTVVVNAGANDLTRVGGSDLDKELNLIQTNLAGAIATVNAAVEHFLARGRGHVVGISSLASRQPLAKQAAYCASKAGLSMYLRSARMELRRKGVSVTDILPGYVMTDIVEGVDIGKIPFAVPATKVAREMVRLMEKKAEVGIVPGFPWRLVRPLLGHLPERLTRF